MEVRRRIDAFHRLGEHLEEFLQEADSEVYSATSSQKLADAVQKARGANPWFTRENVLFALQGIRSWLTREALSEWIGKAENQPDQPKRVGIVMAGNIPLVGFHDYLAVLITGNTVVAKPSSQDPFLIEAISEILCEVEPGFAPHIEFAVNKLHEPDAVIATGSNNSARYFMHYFKKYPHVIRKNRGSVAVLDGSESAVQLKDLGQDVFRYFGLGCRNVSKLYVPKGYDFDPFFASTLDFVYLTENNRYVNNYQYHKTLYLLNKESLLDNELVLLKEDEGMHSPVGVLFYEYYESKTDLMQQLDEKKDEIQCIVSSEGLPFGHSQTPELSDYADGVNTVKFLTNMR